MMKQPPLLRKLDTVAMIVFPMIATAFSLLLRTNFFWSTILFFGVPAIYLALRDPKAIKKALLFALPVGLIAGFVIDYVAINSGSWIVPVTVFPFRVLGVVPVEDLLWGTLLVFNIIMFYEHFLDTKGRQKVDDKYIYAVAILLFLVFLFFTFYVFQPAVLDIDYFYTKMGIVLILIPTVTYLSFVPRLISKYTKVGTYFFALGMLFELTGLHLGQWKFTGVEYVGWLEIASLRFPLEEFVFWLVLFAVCILSYYEFFYDDGK